MKRRDFLLSTGGIIATAGLGSRVGVADVRPCPPPAITVGGGSTSASGCRSGTGGAPGWWLDESFATNSWKQIAKTGTLASVKPPAEILDAIRKSGDRAGLSGGYADPGGILQAWTGASADQDRGEYILAANGGHSDYAGNEVYAIRIRSEDPAWVRLNDPSIDIDASTGPPSAVARFRDGRGRTMHTGGRVQYWNNKIWFPMQGSVTSGQGESRWWVACINRSLLPNAIADTTPVAIDGGAGPWEFYSPPTGSDVFQNVTTVMSYAGYSALDPATGKIWNIGTNQNEFIYSELNTATGTSKLYRHRVEAEGGMFSMPGPVQAFAQVATFPDKRNIIVLAMLGSSEIWVMELARIGVPGEWIGSVYPAKVVNPIVVPGASGAAYREALHTLFVANPAAWGPTVRSLRVPVDSAGNYNRAGDWVWGTLNPGSTTGPNYPALSVQGVFSKVNAIDDMGDGRGALVFCGALSDPTWVYKLP